MLSRKALFPTAAALFVSLSFLTLPIPAFAAEPPERSETLIVYGDDPCPAAEDDEIVVCARRPESERYRIPKSLREDKTRRPSEVSWGSRVQALDDEARAAGPTGCSVIGPAGNVGCAAQRVRDWYAERRSRR